MYSHNTMYTKNQHHPNVSIFTFVIFQIFEMFKKCFDYFGNKAFPLHEMLQTPSW